MSYSRGGILRSNLSSGLPTRVLDWNDYEGIPVQPCNDYYLPLNSALPLTIPWLYDYDITVGQGGREIRTPQRKAPHNLSLHEEIVAFIAYMTPTEHEIEIRKDLVGRFSKLVESFGLPTSSPEPYGSYITGLFLSTSDVDMFVTPHQNQPQRGILSRISRRLATSPPPQFHTSIKERLMASVPVITLIDAKTNLSIDLNAEPMHSKASTQAVISWLRRGGHSDGDAIMRMLVIVVKTFLAIRRCGTTYKGGVNSYVVVWLVVAWVNLELPKLRKRKTQDLTPTSGSPAPASAASSSSDYGEILIAFLKFYGEEFDYKKKQIIIDPQPQYAQKSGYQQQPFLLSLIDPADFSIDLGSKAYAIKHVAASFKEAYKHLMDMETKRLAGDHVGEQGILGSALGGDFMNYVEERDKLAKMSIASV
ncbi:hypothetical protein CVT24_013379 [Panaeolus cyanescens]|uniref:polynucleotide adenylyltransferase n=1 Tax=Panaeolus cyanescens TaxID=181874 RepID=A0A409YMS1_9AGAR|nr:hypothetical protein CVT24_013379 [Panaeolus cyanescens]